MLNVKNSFGAPLNTNWVNSTIEYYLINLNQKTQILVIFYFK
ncbi:hypothetical protein HMPREF0204_13885 [Chryseobacterium gleum ATCC 35910]|uniref:Uncharacterized protein n=1 Tax=Chryseobacterium gleum ATCC 35910 TaxID=525257 RepID=A0ABN0ANZ6_CHRGE|nr:hypothetical protein HMPREF0204_13885 [Chryseobacterium gleum ATCC 35910]